MTFLSRRSLALLSLLAMLLGSSLAFQAAVSGSLPDYKGSGITFNYVEQQHGGSGPGARGIRIFIRGGRDQTYKFKPNPHDDRWYNQNQEAFYRQAAQALADSYLAKTPNHLFPRYGFESKIHGIEYTYEQP